jgi:hypothetical protein
LNTTTEEHSLCDLWFRHLCPAILAVFPFESELLLDFKEFGKDKRMCRISFSVEAGEDFPSLVPSILHGQPSGRLRAKEKADKENDSRDHLDAPGKAEGSRSIDVAATILDKIF